MNKTGKNDMNETDTSVDRYHYFIDHAIKSLEDHFYNEAEKFIINAISINYNAPQAHNLLGALAEFKGDPGFAGRHYLAANALDPTYVPAIRNLRRLTTYSFRKKPINPDLGQDQNFNNLE